MTEPTYEQLQQQLVDLKQQVKAAKEKNKKNKPVELMVEYETGFLQVRRLTSKSINLPTFVVRWILENAQTILKFINDNKVLLAEQNDTEPINQAKYWARQDNLISENPVTRKPRAENKTQEF